MLFEECFRFPVDKAGAALLVTSDEVLLSRAKVGRANPTPRRPPHNCNCAPQHCQLSTSTDRPRILDFVRYVI